MANDSEEISVVKEPVEDTYSGQYQRQGERRPALVFLRGELLAVQQAFALSKRSVPPGLQEFLAAVAAVVPPIEVDRPFGLDVGHLADLLAE